MLPMVLEKNIYYMTLDSIRYVNQLLKSGLEVDFLENLLIFMKRIVGVQTKHSQFRGGECD